MIVYLLRELTKRHKDIWVRVADSDGEFLLVEAAGALPEWVDPEIADNRVSFALSFLMWLTLHQVWINQGKLVIIRPKDITKRKIVTEKISLPESRRIIKEEPNRLQRSQVIEDEAFYRLRNYPKQISENLHSTMVTIPRKVAFFLHQKPGYISAAVEAFYLRDPIALRPLRAKDPEDMFFKPEDLVTVSTRFTRVGYAQLKSQDFPVPKSWAGKLPSSEKREDFERAETGMKLSCGFEMLLSDPQSQDKASVREIKLLLEDVDTGDEKLPTDQEIGKWDKRQDDENWLDINFEDLDRELKGRNKGREEKQGAEGNFGDANAQENLQRIVARFEEFLNDNSAGFEGADFIDDFGSDSDVDDDEGGEEELSDDEEDKEGSFDEEEFSRMMREMMGMPSGAGHQGIPQASTSRNRVEELNDDSEDDTEQIQELSNQMEAELRGTGVLDLNHRQRKAAGKQPLREGQPGAAHKIKDDQADEENREVEDIDINLAKNLLESFQGQAGAAGPAGNMLSMMNLPMPKGDRR